MKKLSGKIVLVDDHPYEKDFLKMALEELNIYADLEFFLSPETALDYLRETRDHIFLIISDMNMPKMNGLDFKKVIDSDERLRVKSVPFIFSSSGATKSQLKEAYEYRLQGYFLKPQDVKDMAKQLELIIRYWIVSVRPDSEELGRQHSVFKL
ncbi:MAG: histidine kinase [Bacteroidetes bacterium]|jgi:CheY-like chemotaxis protein|nr:histidine kinase [Bacteroidota bacterium]